MDRRIPAAAGTRNDAILPTAPFRDVVLRRTRGGKQASDVDFYARSHRRGEADLLNEGPFGPGRLGTRDAVYERLDVFDKRLLGKARLADTGMDNPGLLSPKLDGATLGGDR